MSNFSSPQVPSGLALTLGQRGRKLPPVDPEVRNLGIADGPEAPIAIEFVGLTEEQARAALAAFPGGRRFRLVARSSPSGRA